MPTPSFNTPAQLLLRLTCALLTLLALALPTAQAQTTAQLVPAASEITFTSKQMGVAVEGRFKRFEAQLNFDPKRPEAGRVSFQIDLTSATLGDAMFDAELAKPVWFDTARSRMAVFQSSQIKPLGNNRFEVLGKLQIKGQVRELSVPLTLSSSKNQTLASGQVQIRRLDFRIGEGEWADTSMVANEVQVRFKLAFSGLSLP
ncbi:YceI family protein [Roseateles sp. BYS180W]|uniref:YceI family protein n=1 Tax=Roseateles rivi TaxID=3299028 RepID=A0ABW7FWL8_9BURK